MIFRPALAASLALLSLAGCSSYQPVPNPPEKAGAAFAARTLGDPGLMRFVGSHRNAPAAAPWDIEALTLVALYFSPELDVARADWSVARAGLVTAAERPNPTLGLMPGKDRDAGPGVSPWILGYTLDLPLEAPGRRDHRIAVSRHRADVARLNLAAAAWRVRSGVRRALIALHAAREAAALWAGQEPLLAEAERQLGAQAKAGALAPLETSQAMIALAQAKLARLDAEQQVTRAQIQLAQILGLPLGALDAAEYSFAGLDQPATGVASAEAHRLAVSNRADLLSLLAEFSASDETLRLELARQYPDVHLGPGYTLDQGEGKWTLGLSLSLPVFNQNRGPIAEAQAAREAAAARFAAAQARILAEVDQAVADHAAALASRAALAALREGIDRQIRAARAMQAAGELTKLDLTTALLDANRNTLALLEARTRTETAFAALEDAVQSPLALPEKLWRESPRTSVSSTTGTHE
jgi:outer membrane protein TolC